MSEERLRLKKLIEHWAEHNDEHRARFEESAGKAEEMGLGVVVDNLMKATERATEVSMYLRRALEEFK
jgi:hypothetical protein